MEALNNKALNAVLKRNNLELKKVEKTLQLRRTNSNHGSLNLYFYFSVILSIFGIITFLFFSSLFGVIFMFSAIPLYRKVSKVKKRAKGIRNRIIIISETNVLIQNKGKEIEIPRSNIEEIEIDIKEDSEISSAVLFLKLGKGIRHQIIEIFSDDRRFVIDEMKLIKENFSKILN